MTAELYNANGELVEGAKTPDEVAELQKRSETRKEQREEERADKKKIQEEMLKLSDKDMNFGKLKDKTKKREQAIEKKEREIEEAKKVFVERQTYEYEQDSMVELGIDREDREKVLHCYNNELTSEAITKNEIKEKMNKAYRLAVKPSSYNPINMAIGSEGDVSGKNKNESDTSRQIRNDVFKTKDDDYKKYNKQWKPNF